MHVVCGLLLREMWRRGCRRGESRPRLPRGGAGTPPPERGRVRQTAGSDPPGTGRTTSGPPVEPDPRVWVPRVFLPPSQPARSEGAAPLPVGPTRGRTRPRRPRPRGQAPRESGGADARPPEFTGTVTGVSACPLDAHRGHGGVRTKGAECRGTEHRKPPGVREERGRDGVRPEPQAASAPPDPSAVRDEARFPRPRSRRP